MQKAYYIPSKVHSCPGHVDSPLPGLEWGWRGPAAGSDDQGQGDDQVMTSDDQGAASMEPILYQLC